MRPIFRLFVCLFSKIMTFYNDKYILAVVYGNSDLRPHNSFQFSNELWGQGSSHVDVHMYIYINSSQVHYDITVCYCVHALRHYVRHKHSQYQMVTWWQWPPPIDITQNESFICWLDHPVSLIGTDTFVWVHHSELYCNFHLSSYKIILCQQLKNTLDMTSPKLK